jgi:1,4-dihydroxy-2-naphthoate polyprenyltransferase
MTTETLRSPTTPSVSFPRFWRGVWRVADPKITLASVASIVLGAGVAAHHGPIAWGWLALTLLGIFFVEAAKNASGEIFDWDSGADRVLTEAERTPFSGGKRVLVDQLLSRRQTIAVASLFYGLAVAVGLAIVLFREPAVIWLGLIGLALAYFYHAPPLSLSYRGLGEVAVALAYGPVIASGTYLVQRQAIDPEVVLASLPLGMAIMAFLWINEFPDARADALAGKRTLVVRLGRPAAARVFAALIAATYLGLWSLPAAGVPRGIWLGTIGLPFAIRAALRLLRSPETSDPTSAVRQEAKPQSQIVPAQASTLMAFVLLAIGSAVGIALWP